MTELEKLLMADAIKLLRNEQESLWFDLYIDLPWAINGYWSSSVESRIERIVVLAKAVGATPWQCVQEVLSTTQVYDTIVDRFGLTPNDPWDESLKKHPKFLPGYTVAWGKTVEHIKNMSDDFLVVDG